MYSPDSLRKRRGDAVDVRSLLAAEPSVGSHEDRTGIPSQQQQSGWGHVGSPAVPVYVCFFGGDGLPTDIADIWYEFFINESIVVGARVKPFKPIFGDPASATHRDQSLDILSHKHQ